MSTSPAAEASLEVAVFGGGCFWCTEAVFKALRGVASATPGYAGGHTSSPTYYQVAEGDTGHAEVVRVTFDPKLVSYRDLLTVFFATHDPTSLNRQGHDVGTKYRSAIFYATPQQRAEAERYIAQLNGKLSRKSIVTEVQPLGEFYEAEAFHHDFYDRNYDQPYCRMIIDPKLKKVRERFRKLLKEREG